MPGDQVKRSSVKLNILPVGRKFLMIRDGKQLLMLKAIGGSRSVYSIEEKGIPRTGITRSGKRHFQFSLPKFVNGLEGMNDHSQKSDHVVDQNLHSTVGSTQPKRGHFAKKSTGNNLRHTINHHKGNPAGNSGKQHSKQNLSSSAKKTLPQSSDNANQTTSSSRARNRNVQSESFQSAKSAGKREDPQTVKETRPGKASEIGSIPTQERKNATDRVGKQSSETPVPPSKDNLKKDKVHSEAAKEVKKGKLDNKENDPKLKEAQITKELPSGKVSCKQKTEHVISSRKEQLSAGIKLTKCISAGSKERDVNNEKEAMPTADTHLTSSKPDRLPPVQSDCQKSTSRSSKPKEKLNSTVAKYSPKPTTDLKRQRASTPTPESPVKKSLLGRLSRKRHRSASPVALKSFSTESKLATPVSLTNQIVKPNRESIKLDSKNFEKVRNACKNAISQRKEKTNMDKGNSEPTNTQVKRTGASDNTVTNQVATVKRSLEEKVSEYHVPPPKKKKVSDAAAADLEQNTCENISTVASRSSDSEDGLTKLMKDFQSAMSSPSLKCNMKPSTPSLKGNLRYISKKTSGHFVNGKSPKTVTGNLAQIEKKVEKTKDTVSTKSSSVSVSSEIYSLQPEDISSDEDFESSQEADGDETSKGICRITKDGDLASKPKLSIKIPETNKSPNGNFLVVDEVGFTPDDSNSSHGALPVIEGHKQSLNKLIEQGDVNESKSLPSLPRDDGVDTIGLTTNDKDPEPVATGQMEEDAKMGQKVCLEESETSAKGRKKMDDSADTEVKSTKSTYTQTDDMMEKKDMLKETKILKPELKHQSVQFSSVANSVDPEEITPIVAAMFESECEEKERLKKALEEKIGKEEKWRNMVKDLCRQLRELRQQLAKKEPEKQISDIGVNTAVETSALPVIISTQASQTEQCESAAASSSVSSKPDTCQKTSEGLAKVPTEKTSIQQQNSTRTVIPVSTNVNHRDPPTLKAVTSPSQVIVSDERVANVPMNLTTSVQSQSSQLGVTNGTKVTEKSESTEVIDLTDSEDVNPSESKLQVNKSPVQSRPPVLSQGLPTTSHKFITVTSKPIVLQSNSKSPAKDQLQTIATRPVTSQAVLPQVPSLRSMHSEKTMPTIIRSPVSSAQSIQRSIQNRQIPSQFPLTSVMRTSAPMVTQLIATQPKQSVPPPLHPAPNIAASVYTKPQNSHVPMLSPNVGMLVRTQAPQRQDVVLSGVSQQVVQHHGLTPQQQQQVKHSVLIEEFKRGMLQPGLTNYQGSASIILPNGSHQLTALPLRLPQVQATLQGKKVMLDEKRDGLLQRQFQQAYQLNAQNRIGNAPQLKAVLTEVDGNDKAHLQGYRNFKVTAAPTGITSQAHRYPPPPAYVTSSATAQPVTHIYTSATRTQPTNGMQQREVVNGVKQYVPLTSLNTQARNTVVSERTWFPNSRQGEGTSHLNQGNHQHVNVNPKGQSKHPASLPILHSSATMVGKGSLLPSPSIRISHSPEGVVLSWNITTNQDHPTVRKYFLYAYQVLNTPPSTSHWKRIGEVGALPPPMACTLNQFQPGSTYFLAICAVDVYDRPGLFSKMEEVVIPR